MSACNHFYNFFKEYKKKYDKIAKALNINIQVLFEPLEEEKATTTAVAAADTTIR